MKKAILLAAALATVGSVGCTTTNPGRQYAADAPPPVQKNTRPAADGDLPKLPPSQARVNPEDIDETNYKEQSRKLESDLKFDGRALSQAK